MKKRIKQLAAILILAGLSLGGRLSFAVEWEMMDRFSVDGYSEFRGTVAVPSGGFTVGGSSFAVQYGKIGIGTSTPSFLLHISTAGGVAGDLVVISTGDINVIRMTGAGEIHASKFIGDGSGISMVVASSVAANGVRPGSIVPGAIVNADISTSAAISPTKIYGTAAVLGANTFTSSQTITGAGGLLVAYGVSAVTATFTAQDASVPGVTISSGLIVSSGSIGIGTSSPSGKLSVKPAASDAFSLFISSQDGTTGNLVVAKSGYVGIGTATPGSYKLDVAGGKFRAASNVYDSGWFAVSNSTAYTKTHNLATTKLLITVYMATQANGSDGQLYVSYSEPGRPYGPAIINITTTNLTVVLANYGWVLRDGSGGGSVVNNGYARVVVMALE